VLARVRVRVRVRVVVVVVVVKLLSRHFICDALLALSGNPTWTKSVLLKIIPTGVAVM
jgi:hypothetical protein